MALTTRDAAKRSGKPPKQWLATDVGLAENLGEQPKTATAAEKTKHRKAPHFMADEIERGFRQLGSFPDDIVVQMHHTGRRLEGCGSLEFDNARTLMLEQSNAIAKQIRCDVDAELI